MKRETVTPEQARKLLARRDKSKDLPLNEIFAAQLTWAGIDFQREFQFHGVRKWRADFVINRNGYERICLVDLDGGTFSRSRLGHSSGVGIAKSFEKFNEAAIMGYRVLRFDAPMVRDGVALQTILRALGIGEHKNFKIGHAR